MKNPLVPIWVTLAQAWLVSAASGISVRDSLRGFRSSGQVVSHSHTNARESAQAEWPPSCQLFVEMLGRVYYMRDQLDRTTGSISTIGYETGREWVIDQGIGAVTPDTLHGVVCSLLSNASKPVASLLAQHAEPVTEEKPPAADAKGGWLPSVPGWLGGASDGETSGTASELEESEQLAGQQNFTKAQNLSADLPDSNGTADAPPVTAVGRGCPAGSMQNVVLEKLKTDFDGIKKDDEAVHSIAHALENLISIEHGVLALYNFRGCPPASNDEFKTQHVCEAHRDELAQSLQLLQAEVPQVRSKFFSLQSRLGEIDSGKSEECVSAESQSDEKRRRQPSLQPKQLSWCLELEAVVDALLDGRRAQTLFTKDMGDGMQKLGTMSYQLNQRIQDPTLRKDKIPMNALKAMTKSWQSLQLPVQQLRLLGSAHARHMQEIDVSVLQLSALLRNASVEQRCASEGFRMRYSSQTCASLKVQLGAAAEARQSDLKALEDKVQNAIGAASAGLIANQCTAPPKVPGCWVRMPTGCPSLPAWESADKWTRDIFGEQSTGAATNKVVCTISRKAQMDVLCGSADAEMLFNRASGKP